MTYFRERRGVRGWGRFGAGRLRQRLAELLSEKGFTVKPEEISQNFPVHRRFGADGVAWEVYGYHHGRTVQLHSFDTMTECCKKGIVIRHVDFGFWEVSVDDPA